jgi:hypothetical protein
VRTSLLRLVFALLVATTLVRTASACASMANDYDMGVYATADVVVRAKVAGYRVDPQTAVAYFDLETVETLAGRRVYLKPANGEILKDVRWANPSLGIPEIWKTEAIIVGVMASPDTNGAIQLSLAQQFCNPDFILKDSERNRELLASAFSMGESVVLTRDFLERRGMESALRVMEVRLRILIASKAYQDPQKMEAALRNMKAELEKLSIFSDRRPEPAEK